MTRKRAAAQTGLMLQRLDEQFESSVGSGTFVFMGQRTEH